MINKLDYSSYKTPKFEELYPGLEYEYVTVKMTTPYSFKEDQNVRFKRGGDVCNITNIYTCDGIQYIDGVVTKSLYKDPHYQNMLPRKVHCIPTTSLHAFSSTQQTWQKGIYGTVFGLTKKEDFLKAIKTNTMIIPKHIACLSTYNLEYLLDDGSYVSEYFSPEEGKLEPYEQVKLFINKNKDNITRLIRLNAVSTPFHRSILTTKRSLMSEQDLNKNFNFKKPMVTLKTLRDALIATRTIGFFYNGLTIEIKPTIITTPGRFDFSKSIYINGKPIEELSKDKEAHSRWIKADSTFIKELYSFLNTDPTAIFPSVNNVTLIKHLLFVRSSKLGETEMFVIRYKDEKDTTQKCFVKEFSEERVRATASYRINGFDNQIIDIKPWKAHKKTGT